MKLYKQIIFILIVFFKTETLFSENNLFNVDNIQLEKNVKTTNKAISDLAIKKGFQKLITKILLKEDINKLSDLNFSSIKQLVTYYQRKNILRSKNNIEVTVNIYFHCWLIIILSKYFIASQSGLVPDPFNRFLKYELDGL